jgi:hypothetical protein
VRGHEDDEFCNVPHRRPARAADNASAESRAERGVARPTPALTFEDARKAMGATEARANNWNVTIIIVDSAGVPIYLGRMTGASARFYDIAINKARTFASTGLTTEQYGQRLFARTIDTAIGGT